MATAYPYYLAGRAETSGKPLSIIDKYSGRPEFAAVQAGPEEVLKAIDAAVDSFPALRSLAAFERQATLEHVALRMQERQSEFAQILCIEAGKPIRDARGEVERAIDTFRIAAAEAVRITGEFMPLDISPRAAGYEAITRRVPIGPCSFITPFNFPLNLVAHKVAPAIAMGCPFVLKPAPTTPISALMLGELLAETKLPRGAFSILPCQVDDAAPLVLDDRIKLLSFTGSAAVGWQLKSRAGKKKVVLELGGNAACIIDRDTDLETVTKRLIIGGFYQSGQSCISVQRVLAHESIYAELSERLVKAASELKWGNPRDESVFLGPLISEKDVNRISQWIDEAVAAGAKVLCGGRAHDRIFYEATILQGVPRSCKLSCEEAFGPVMILEPYSRFEEACAAVNKSRYGLQAGVFTPDLNHAWHAFDHLEVGGVIINDVPSMRVDSMPYGGVKDSGLGREGVRYAMEEMSEIRLMVIKR